MTIVWTEVHAIDALRSRPTGSDACATSTSLAKVRLRGTLIPHGEKINKSRGYKSGRGNAIALPPPTTYQGPLYPWALHLRNPCHVAPHTGAHVVLRCRVAPRHVAAPCASCAPRGPPAALPRGLRAGSHPRGGPARHVSARRLPRSPRQHLQVNTPLFLRFFNKKYL